MMGRTWLHAIVSSFTIPHSLEKTDVLAAIRKLKPSSVFSFYIYSQEFLYSNMRILSLLDSPLKEGSVWVTITVQDVENG